MDSNKIVRLFDKDGNHRLTIMECCDDPNNIDLADPDGKVLNCQEKNGSILIAIAVHLADAQELHPLAIINA